MSPFAAAGLLVATLSISTTAFASDNGPAQQSGPTARAASAQTDADEIRRRVKDGQKVFVLDDQGRELKGRIGELSADSLMLLVGPDRTELPYNRIVRIDRPRDGVANGMLIGLGIGAGFGLVSAAAVAGGDGGWGSPDAGDMALIAPALFGAIGAGIGLGVDAMIGGEKTLYRREGTTRISVSPALGRRGGGVAVSVSW